MRRLALPAALMAGLLLAPTVARPPPTVHVDGGTTAPTRTAQAATGAVPPAEIRACLTARGWTARWADWAVTGGVGVVPLAQPTAGLYWLPPLDVVQVADWLGLSRCDQVEHELHHRYDATQGLWGTWRPPFEALADVDDEARGLLDRDDPHLWHALIRAKGWRYDRVPAAYVSRFYGYTAQQRTHLPLLGVP